MNQVGLTMIQAPARAYDYLTDGSNDHGYSVQYTNVDFAIPADSNILQKPVYNDFEPVLPIPQKYPVNDYQNINPVVAPTAAPTTAPAITTAPEAGTDQLPTVQTLDNTPEAPAPAPIEAVKSNPMLFIAGGALLWLLWKENKKKRKP